MIPSEKRFEDLVHSKIVLDSKIASMSEKERRILKRFESGCTQRQIAKEMGVSQANISRALKKIRKTLNGQGVRVWTTAI